MKEKKDRKKKKKKKKKKKVKKTTTLPASTPPPLQKPRTPSPNHSRASIFGDFSNLIFCGSSSEIITDDPPLMTRVMTHWMTQGHLLIFRCERENRLLLSAVGKRKKEDSSSSCLVYSNCSLDPKPGQ